MLVGSTYRITGLQYTYGCATLSSAYVNCLYLANHWVTLRLWCATSNRAYFCYPYPSESLRFPSLVGVQPKVQPFIVKSYEITELHYTYGNATLSAD